MSRRTPTYTAGRVGTCSPLDCKGRPEEQGPAYTCKCRQAFIRMVSSTAATRSRVAQLGRGELFVAVLRCEEGRVLEWLVYPKGFSLQRRSWNDAEEEERGHDR